MEEVLILPIGAWFFNNSDIRDYIPVDTLCSIVEWIPNKDDSREMNPIWSYPEKDLSDRLQQSYSRVQSLSDVRRWCRQSAEWQSLNSKKLLWTSLHLFPIGSIVSRFASLIIAEMVRDTLNKDVLVHEPIVDDERKTNDDLLIQACAIRLWGWLFEQYQLGRHGTPSLNVTACSHLLKRVYRWVASLVPYIFIDVDIIVWDWSWDFSDLVLVPPANLPYLIMITEFLNYYFQGANPNDEHSRRRYQHYLSEFEPIINHSDNHGLESVLKAWLDWSEDRREDWEKKQTQKEWIMQHPIARGE